MPNSQGRFAWHELATTDAGAAAAFYSRVTSWRTQPSDFSDAYMLLMRDHTAEGGIEAVDRHPIPGGATPHWMPYVRVYDVDACARQVKSLGGEVRVAPREVPNVGGWAVIADPQGALIGMYEPEAAPTPGVPAPASGDFSWHELVTTDFKAAFDFYRPLFQWEKTGEFDMGEMGTYFMFGQRGQTYGGMFNRVPDMPPPTWLSYICVDDVESAANAVKESGGKVILGPMDVPGGDRIVQGVDPQGAWFALHTVAKR
jgi:uncharacterized protein